MLALLLACHRPNSSPSDDSALSEVTDTGLDTFNPEADLEWRIIEGTDGDCGTDWPLGRPMWEFDATWSGKASDDGVFWTIEPALSRSDVWDAFLVMYFPFLQEGNVGLGARWRMQCDHGSMLLLGLSFGSSWRTHGHKTAYADHYAASFAAPIHIALVDSTFDVAGELWSAHYGKSPDSMEAWPATFTGTITNVGTEAIAIKDGNVEASHLVITTDAEIFVQLFPQSLWLTESEGLVQFEGPLDDALAIAAF